MSHFSYIDIANRIAAKKWGREYATSEDAQRSLIADADLGDACLLAILEKLNGITRAIATHELDRLANEWSLEFDRVKAAWLEPRELIHGPAPDSVRRWLNRTLESEVGHALIRGSAVVFVRLYEPGLPDSGSAARRDYDKWRRRKQRPA